MNLEAIMKENAISGYRLAQLTDIGQTSIADYRAGRSSPSLINAKKIADALGVTLDELVQGAPVGKIGELVKAAALQNYKEG